MSTAAAFDDDAAADVDIWGIVVAGGAGSRFGGEKQFATLGGKRVLDWSLAAARQACGSVVLVVPADHHDLAEPAADHVVVGGATRSASVRAGLAAVASDASDDCVIVVHDAARPFATAELFHSVISAVRSGADGAVPALPVTDTVKQVDDSGTITATLDRARLMTVQTPQAFRFAALREAHSAGADATDDAALVEAIGGRVVVVPGEETNRKITTPDDLVAPR